MTTFNEFLEEQLKDPEFRKEYEALEPEMNILNAVLDARASLRNFTQEEQDD